MQSIAFGADCAPLKLLFLLPPLLQRADAAAAAVAAASASPGAVQFSALLLVLPFWFCAFAGTFVLRSSVQRAN